MAARESGYQTEEILTTARPFFHFSVRQISQASNATASFQVPYTLLFGKALKRDKQQLSRQGGGRVLANSERQRRIALDELLSLLILYQHIIPCENYEYCQLRR